MVRKRPPNSGLSRDFYVAVGIVLLYLAVTEPELRANALVLLGRIFFPF
jgi:hypothetical protein